MSFRLKILRGVRILPLTFLMFVIAMSAVLPAQERSDDEFDKDDPFKTQQPIEPGKYSGIEALRIGSQVMQKAEQVNKNWLFAPKQEIRRWAYTFRAQAASGEKLEKKIRLDRDDPDTSNSWPDIRGNTLIPISQGVFQLKPKTPNVEVTKTQIKLHFVFEGDDSAFQMVGNGLDGSWYGFFQAKAAEGMLYVNAKDHTLIGVKLPSGDSEKYTDYVALDETGRVPRRVEIQRGTSYFDMRFKAYEPGIWIFDRSEYKSDRRKISTAVLSDLTINGDVPVEIKKDKAK